MTTQNRNITSLEMADDSQPLIQIRYIGDDATHTAQVDNDGGSSELRIILVDTTTGTTNIDGNTHDTLDALVTAINAVAGWEARRHNGAGDYDTGTDDFVDAAAASIGRSFTNYLYRDESEVITSQVRISNPSVNDEGLVDIHRIEGQTTFASGTSAINVYTDPAGGTRTLVRTVAVTTTATEQVFIDTDDAKQALRLRGPVLVEAVGSAAQADCAVRVEWTPVV